MQRTIGGGAAAARHRRGGGRREGVRREVPRRRPRRPLQDCRRLHGPRGGGVGVRPVGSGEKEKQEAAAACPPAACGRRTRHGHPRARSLGTIPENM
jgi:hypothetical protein